MEPPRPLRITLVLAASPHDPLRLNDPFAPLSLPLLAAAAPGHEYTLVDMLAGDAPDPRAPADLVGISYRSTAERTAFELADAFRARDVPVVLGGAQASVTPHRAAAHADAVVVGEGEPLWPVVLEDFAAGGLRRFYVASPTPLDGRGEPVFQLAAYPDLCRVMPPAPRRDLLPRRYRFDTVQAARGCPMDCEFCSVTGLFGKAVRTREVDQVVAEVERFPGFYYLLDDTVFGRPASHGFYRELYERIGALPVRRPFVGQANLDAVASAKGREVVRAAARAGLVYAQVGIESVDPAVLERSGAWRKMGAGSPAEAPGLMRSYLRFLRRQGIFVSGWFTLGYEGDTLASVERSLAFCLETGIVPVLCPLEALPGTRLYERLRAEGRLAEDRRLNVVHPTLSPEALLGALDAANRRGLSSRRIWRRTWDFWRRSRRHGRTRRERVEDGVRRAAFALVLQYKLRAGVVGLVNELNAG